MVCSPLRASCSLLKGRDNDGFPTYQEKFVRECIRKFPYCDVTLLQQLVRSIAPVDIVGVAPQMPSCHSRCALYAWRRVFSWPQGNDPTALSVLTQAITGQVGFMDADFCTTCGEKGAQKRCSACKMVRKMALSAVCYSQAVRGGNWVTYISFFCGTRWFIVKKPARNCTGLLTRKCARSCRSRERNKSWKQQN